MCKYVNVQIYKCANFLMKYLSRLLCCFFAWAAVAIPFLQAQQTYIYCGLLLPMDGEGIENASLVIEKNKISRIERGFVKVPSEALFVDLRDKTVLPGLIDCHVHLEWEQSRSSYSNKYVLNDADIAFRSAIYARRTLEAGFTTVRDLGGTGVNIALRNAIDAGLCTGPRILTAGRVLSITGGHGDHGTGSRWDLFDPPMPEIGIADGPEECRTAVRTQIKQGADWIKVAATGGVLSLARDGSLPHYSEDELEVIVKTARDLGVDVAAHAHGDEGLRRAVEAGVVSIEHGSFMSESTMEAMKKHGTWYVPTLTAGWACSDSAKYAKGFFPEVVRKKAEGVGPKIQGTAAKCVEKGVKIAFGTDAGVFPHGKNALEFKFLAQAGMPNKDILLSATLNAATMLRMENRIGSITAGKLADLVAVEGNPLTDISAMQRICFVMKDGAVVKKP
jgi:imidazolonepropionase-like amidohydrolase